MIGNSQTKLTRLYEECEKALDEEKSSQIGGAIIDRFNDVLAEIKTQRQADVDVQQIESVERTGAGIVAGAPPRPRANDLQRVKFRLETLAEAIGVNLHGSSQVLRQPQQEIVGEQPQIVVKNIQNQSQNQSAQAINLDRIYEQVDKGNFSDDERQRLLELLDLFKDELQSTDPDESRIMDVINSAKALSLDVGAKMLYLAIKNNIDAFSG